MAVASSLLLATTIDNNYLNMRMSIGASRRSRSSQHCFHTPVRLSQLLVLLLALCALLAEAAAGDLDYWKILGLRRGASEADIKKSYRKLSKKFHPDKNKSEDAEQRFVEVSQGGQNTMYKL